MPRHLRSTVSRAVEPRWGGGVAALLVLLAAAFAFAQVGVEGTLHHDTGLYIYSGQQLLRGVPPYASIFDLKTPLGPMLCALGTGLGRQIGIDDVLGARLLFLLLSCGTVVALYLLVLGLFGSRWQAILSCSVFIAFRGYGVSALAGPLPKTAAVLFVTCSLACLVGRRWFAAALFGSLAGLTWQPAGVYGVAAVLLAWFQSEGRGARRRASSAALAGLLVPVAAVGLYFLSRGALFDLVDAAIVFPLVHHDNARSVGVNLQRIGNALFGGFGGAGFLLVLGLFMMGPLYVWRARLGEGNVVRSLAEGRFAGLLLTLPLPVVWSLRDFQNYPDLFVLLPYAAVGCGWLLFEGLDAVAGRLRPDRPSRRLLPVIMSLLLIAFAAREYSHVGQRQRLPEQRLAVEQLLGDYGEAARFLSIGVPQAMVLLERTNPTRYGTLLTPALLRQMESRLAGGFGSWLDSLSGFEPDVLIVDPTTGFGFDERQARLWRRWLRDFEKRPAAGEWIVLERKGRRSSEVAPPATASGSRVSPAFVSL